MYRSTPHTVTGVSPSKCFMEDCQLENTCTESLFTEFRQEN